MWVSRIVRYEGNKLDSSEVLSFLAFICLAVLPQSLQPIPRTPFCGVAVKEHVMSLAGAFMYTAIRHGSVSGSNTGLSRYAPFANYVQRLASPSVAAPQPQYETGSTDQRMHEGLADWHYCEARH